MEDIFESLINDQLHNEFGSTENFLDATLVTDLKANLLRKFEEDKMYPAGVGKNFTYEKNTRVRGDLIYWLDRKNNNSVENRFLEIIEDFIAYLNRTCYAGINDYEFHYALYEKGSFYKKHRDQFKSDYGRKFSLVCYLNENWTPNEGGEIVLYTNTNEYKLLPTAGRAVFFKSDEVDHEVLTANRDRLSIAGWLKSV